jgi:hypothetical protein
MRVLIALALGSNIRTLQWIGNQDSKPLLGLPSIYEQKKSYRLAVLSAQGFRFMLAMYILAPIVSINKLVYAVVIWKPRSTESILTLSLALARCNGPNNRCKRPVLRLSMIGQN